MKLRSSSWASVLGGSVLASALVAACGGTETTSGSNNFHGTGGTTGSHASSTGSGAGGNAGGGDSGTGGGNIIISTGTGGSGTGGQSVGFDVKPTALQTISVNLGQTMPTVDFSATLNGSPISAGWSVDRGDIGSIPKGPSATATFTPTGTSGGFVTVKAGLNGQTVSRQILVKLVAQQNGANTNVPSEVAQIGNSAADFTAGGGIGGVGGEGLGGAADATSTTALGAPTSDGSDKSLAFLYPYQGTVFPRGILAPLLQWSSTLGDADAIQIELSTSSGSFSWKGLFGKPAVATANGKPFIRHPIPQDVWETATNSAGGTLPDGTPDKLTVKLTVASGGVAYGPIQQTWTIAPARLSGTIYYNSYGTQLAKNLGGAVGGDKMFGGAVLSIKVGDTAPKLVAGGNGGTDKCRVCHSVAANGSRLVTQWGSNNDVPTSVYDLTTGDTAGTLLAHSTTMPAIYPDGTMELAADGTLLPLPNDATPITATGITVAASNLGSPAFAPTGKALAFNPFASTAITNPQQKLIVMSFDPTTFTFSGPVTVADYTGQDAGTRPGWPAFLPDSQSLVFHRQTVAGIDIPPAQLVTRKGAKAQIHFTSVNSAQDVTPLNQLNGLDANGNSYLPKLAQPITLSCTGDGSQVGNIDPDHGDDVDLNYEPTVLPIASGGYVWVVFTSRRMYGTVADIPPFCSDPRGVDLVQNITPKKLWVAAIDLNAKPGTDSSHPAFYLPAQELLAGNSRGFWVLDPCHADGASCSSGDQCCGGFCEPGDDGTTLVCTNTVPDGHCSMLAEKCTTAADCCDGTNVCVNGFCSQKGIN